MRFLNVRKRSLAPLVLAMCGWLLWPAQSLARALIRFVHGVPGVGQATVSVNDGGGDQQLGSIAFGQSTTWRSIRSGRFTWTLSGGGKTLASGTATVGDGAYDILVLERGLKVWLGIYRARGGEPGTALVRVIHGAPELGSPELTVDGKQVVHSLAYTQATPYLPLAPGMHTLGAMRPGDSTPIVGGVSMRVVADRAYSAVVVGTRGQRVRVVTLVDRGAPLVRRASAKVVSASDQGAATGRTIVVAHGDSLWSIARQIVGPDASDDAVEHELGAIWDRNQGRIGTGDPNLIFPGTHLTI